VLSAGNQPFASAFHTRLRLTVSPQSRVMLRLMIAEDFLFGVPEAEYVMLAILVLLVVPRELYQIFEF
jgi:hypothetical protein